MKMAEHTWNNWGQGGVQLIKDKLKNMLVGFGNLDLSAIG
jgi:hypothetical protein